MNKTLVLIIMLFYIAADVVGHDIYRPILTECRSWLVVTSSHASDFFNFESYETVKTVSGDTVIDGHSCKIIDNVRKDTGESSRKFSWKRTGLFIGMMKTPMCLSHGWISICIPEMTYMRAGASSMRVIPMSSRKILWMLTALSTED